MSLDMWFKDDIGNVLMGIELATARMATDRPDVEASAFREGFRAALEAVAVSFGLVAPSLSQPEIRIRRAPDLALPGPRTRW